MIRPLIALAALSLFCISSPKPMMPRNVPTTRLLANSIANVRAHPDDPDAHYAVGRIRFLMYCASDPTTLPMYSDKPPFRFPGPAEFPNPKPRDDVKTLQLVRDAIFNLRSAVRLDKGREPGLYRLTLACTYEAAAPIAAKAVSGATPQMWRSEAERQYGLSFDEALPEDSQATRQDFGRWISVEAGEAVLRLNPQSPRKEAIQKHLARMKSLPPGPISPIVFSLEAARPLDDLLDPSRTVTFDLNGTGEPQRWPWLRPETAILVWQPDPSVPITSGRQLFGSATWWLLFRDGYAALAALDNDRNGWLEGKELYGLAVWRDANGNGRSDAGEVVSVGATGIKGISVTADGRIGRSPVNSQGLRMRDGRVLPTYDWVAEPSRPRQ